MEIEYEMEIGSNNQHQEYLLQRNLEDLLESSMTNKLIWLFSIWTSRENEDQNYLNTETPHIRNKSTLFKYERWKQRS